MTVPSRNAAVTPQSLDLSWRRMMRLGVRIIFALCLIFVGLMVGLIMYATKNLDFLSDAADIWFRLAQAIGLIAAVGTLLVFFNAVQAWTSSRYRIWGKLQATLFALVSLGFLWFVFAGHLINFSSNF